MKKIINIILCLGLLITSSFAGVTIRNSSIKNSLVHTPSSGFKTQWTVSGDEIARTITLPLMNNGTFNCTINWGDGSPNSTVTAYNSANRIHTYQSNGTYVVEIIGSCPSWSFNNTGDKLKIIGILNWGTLDKFTGFTYLSFGFHGCSNLNYINPNSSIIPFAGLTTVQSIFQGCTSLTSASLSENLFKLCTSLGASAFYNSFNGDTGLTTIPVNFFRYNTNVTINAFNSTFLSSGLTSIPQDIFRYNVNASNNAFYFTFSNCTNLSSYGSDLFKYNVNAVIGAFQYTFQNCNKLQIRRDTFCSIGEENTRFLNKSVDFTNCFIRSSFTGVQGTVPDLWNYNFGSGTPVKTACFRGAGNNSTSISNYADIPVDWK